MSAPLLDVRRLTVARRDGTRLLPALRDVSLQLFPGEAVALVGESGSGKSTLARAVVRLLDATGRVESGEILFEGADLVRIPERAMRAVRGRRIGMVLQHPRASLNPVLTVREHLVEALRAHQDISRRAARERALALMADAGIPDPLVVARRYPLELSGGLAQRVAIALGVCHRPALLIADEPTSALDPARAFEVLELIAELRRRHRMALLLISHDLAAVRGFSDRVAVMYHGRLVEIGATAESLGAPRHPYTRALVECALDLAGAEPGATLRTIPGLPPRLDLESAGCSFAPRCPVAESACAAEIPRPVTISPTHWAACLKTEPGGPA